MKKTLAKVSAFVGSLLVVMGVAASPAGATTMWMHRYGSANYGPAISQKFLANAYKIDYQFQCVFDYGPATLEMWAFAWDYSGVQLQYHTVITGYNRSGERIPAYMYAPNGHTVKFQFTSADTDKCTFDFQVST